MSEKSNALIIDPKLLAEIQAACKRRAAELEAAGSAAAQSGGRPAALLADAIVVSPQEEAQRFAVAIDQMPAPVRAFFEHEDPVPHRRESTEERAERDYRTDQSLAQEELQSIALKH